MDVVIDLKDLDTDESAIETKRIDDKPEWIDRLEPIQNLATNVGAKIRNRIRDSLNKGPPGWAAEMLRESISKDVYKGNAAGPTKVCNLILVSWKLYPCSKGGHFDLYFLNGSIRVTLYL